MNLWAIGLPPLIVGAVLTALVFTAPVGLPLFFVGLIVVLAAAWRESERRDDWSVAAKAGVKALVIALAVAVPALLFVLLGGREGTGKLLRFWLRQAGF